MVSMLLSASVERVGVSHMQDFNVSLLISISILIKPKKVLLTTALSSKTQNCLEDFTALLGTALNFTTLNEALWAAVV